MVSSVVSDPHTQREAHNQQHSLVRCRTRPRGQQKAKIAHAPKTDSVVRRMTPGTIQSAPLSSLHCKRFFLLVHGGMLRHLLRLIISFFAVVILRVSCFQHPQNLKRLPFLHPVTESMSPSTTAVPLSVQEALSSDRPKIAILRVQGPDCKGIVAAFAQVLYGQ